MALPAVDPSSRLWALVGRAEAQFKGALINAVLAAKDQHSLDELAELLESGNAQEAIDQWL